MNTMRMISTMMFALSLAACASTSPSEADAAPAAPPAASPAVTADVSIEDTAWRLAAADAGALSTLEAARQVTMVFADGRVSGHGGCNRYTAAYQIENNQLVLEPVAATKMLCMDDANTVEQAFFATLAEPLSLSREDDALVLGVSKGGVLRFVPDVDAKLQR